MLVDTRCGRLFVHEAGSLGNICYDSGGIEIAEAVETLTAGDNPGTGLSGIVNQFDDPFKLRAIVQWSHFGGRVKTITDLYLFGKLCEFSNQQLIDLFMHIKPFDGNADLTTVFKNFPHELFLVTGP